MQLVTVVDDIYLCSLPAESLSLWFQSNVHINSVNMQILAEMRPKVAASQYVRWLHPSPPRRNVGMARSLTIRKSMLTESRTTGNNCH